jgi:lipoprotein-anchoring transpeptidase ErfK/SrfK
MRQLAVIFAALCLGLPASANAAELSREAVNTAQFVPPTPQVNPPFAFKPAPERDPLVVKAQILLDRAGISPGAINGQDDINFAKAISTFETSRGLFVDGKLDVEVWEALGGEAAAPVLIDYKITAKDKGYDFAERIPEDYGEKAKLKRLAYTSLAEMLAERFHMDLELFKELNGGDVAAGSTITVAAVGEAISGPKVTHIEVDKRKGQVRAYSSDGKLVAAYPATIGSADTPSPSGTVEVKAIAPDPKYYYRPDKNFQQGDNTEPLTIAAGPNNPVGAVWIDLSKDSYGIHGTPNPSTIGEAESHGCVRLTNWDAEELAELVEKGTVVAFLE